MVDLFEILKFFYRIKRNEVHTSLFFTYCLPQYARNSIITGLTPLDYGKKKYPSHGGRNENRGRRQESFFEAEFF